MLLIFPYALGAQSLGISHNTNEHSSKLTDAAVGSIHFPSVLNIKITTAPAINFVFDNWDAYKNGIVKLAEIHAKIRSTHPWMLMVTCTSGSLQSGYGSNIPSNLLKIKPSSSAQAFIPITQSPRPILQSSGSSVVTDQDFDLKMEAPLQYRGGDYNGSLMFSLTSP